MPKAESPPDLNSVIDFLKGKGKMPPIAVDEAMLRKIAAPKPTPKDPITEKNIDRFEEDTIKAASGAIRVLEDALARWDAIKDKPGEFREKFEDYRKFHAELVGWEQKILKSKAKGEELDFFARVDRLLGYSRICEAHR